MTISLLKNLQKIEFVYNVHFSAIQMSQNKSFIT